MTTSGSINKHSRKCKKKKNRVSHSRTITPFDPITNGLSFNLQDLGINNDNDNESNTTLDTDDDDGDYGIDEKINNMTHHRNKNRNKNLNKKQKNKQMSDKHEKTMTIQIQDTKLLNKPYSNSYHHTSPSHSISTPISTSMNTPEPTPLTPQSQNHLVGNNSSNTLKITNNHHRKAMSHGPRMLISSSSPVPNSRRSASIIPNMEEFKDDDSDDLFDDLDIDLNDDRNTTTPPRHGSLKRPKLMNSVTSPILESASNVARYKHTDSDDEDKQDDMEQENMNENKVVIIHENWDLLGALNEASDEDDNMSDIDEDVDDDCMDSQSIIYNTDGDDELFDHNDDEEDTDKENDIEMKEKDDNPAGKVDIDSENDADRKDDNNNNNKAKTKFEFKSAFRSQLKPKTPKHRRLESAPVNITDKNKYDEDDYVYRTWNYEEEMSDELKSNISDDDDEEDEDDEDDDDEEDEKEVDADDMTFGTERVFSTFAKELAITSENPKFIFESLSKICVSLRSESINNDDHKLSFNSPILQYERVISFLKLLGFEADYEQNAYILSKRDNECIQYALSACQQQLIEITKKSSTYQVIVTSRLRNGSITATSLIRKSISLAPPPPPIEEEKSTKVNNGDGLELDIDADRCQLYELIWSSTHNNNTDHKAKEVILLCYPIITSPLRFLKLLEARFFNDDHGRASYSTSCESNYNYNMFYNNLSSNNASNNPSPSYNPSQSPTVPSSLPPLTPAFAGGPSSITFDYERIQSSYGVQKKVVHMIRIWMQKYWMEDWNLNNKLLAYIDEFVKKANKAYGNDIDFDDNERNKGLELIDTIHKTIQKQKAETKFDQSDLIKMNRGLSLCQLSSTASASLAQRKNNNDNNNNIRQRSASSNNDLRRTTKDFKRKPIMNGRKRRQSLHKRKISFLSSPRSSNNSSTEIPNDLLKISNTAITNQLSLYIFKKYCLIKPRECLYQYNMRQKKQIENPCPNIKIYKDTFNNIVKWVQSSILLQQQVSKRARIIKKWIKITDELFNIRCFQGFVAVQCALASNAIYTLKDAWNQTNVLKRKHHTKFKEIKVIMSASRNFENLRRLQREAHAPLIPYFGIFCKDLIYIQEGISKRNQDGMINWNKLWRIYELIKEHLQYQQTPYTRIIETDYSMQQWLEIELKRSGMLQSDHLDKMSRDVAQNDKKSIKPPKSLKPSRSLKSTKSLKSIKSIKSTKSTKSTKSGRHQKSFTMFVD